MSTLSKSFRKLGLSISFRKLRLSISFRRSTLFMSVRRSSLSVSFRKSRSTRSKDQMEQEFLKDKSSYKSKNFLNPIPAGVLENQDTL